jgi:hypothetical protein
MYKHILIPTDGSQSATNGIPHAIALAKTLGAEVTGMTVTVPSQIFADSKRTTAIAEKYLGQVKDAAATAGGELQAHPRRARTALPGHYRHREKKRLRPDRDGVPRTARGFRTDSRQRNRQGADAQYHSRSRLSLLPLPPFSFAQSILMTSLYHSIVLPLVSL